MLINYKFIFNIKTYIFSKLADYSDYHKLIANNRTPSFINFRKL